MQLETFEKYLQCPQCFGKLNRKIDTLFCIDTNHKYPIIDGVPMLLKQEEQSMLSKDMDTAVQMKREFKQNFVSKTIQVLKKMVGSTLHMPISQSVVDIWKSFDDELRLEIGSGTKHSSPLQINLDIDKFGDVNVVASALDIPFEDETFKLVRNIAVLEHIKNPMRMVDEIYRVLQPRGYVYTEVPFLQHFHAYPNDFQRYTTEGLKTIFRKFDIVEVGVCVGPSSALTAVAADWFELLSFSKNRFINDLFRLIPLLLLLPIKYMDYLLVKNPRAHELASGLYILCSKPDKDKVVL